MQNRASDGPCIGGGAAAYFWRACLFGCCCCRCLTQHVSPASLLFPLLAHLLQAAQRGQKQSTAGEEDDPLASRYGDPELVQSQEQTGRVWTDVASLTPALAGQAVLVRARVLVPVLVG